MQGARAFFFVCLGTLCLVATYHLGAQSARAQAGVTVQGLAVGIFDPRAITFVRDGLFSYSPDGRAGPYTIPVPVPGGSPVIATGSPGSSCGISGVVVLEDGNVYAYEPCSSETWQLQSNILGSPTAVTQSTWGQLKAKYATPAAGNK
jgi:hypothetical protein